MTLSMDGKGCWRDSVFVEQFWRTLQYEEVYLHAYDSVRTPGPGSGGFLGSTIDGDPSARLTDNHRMTFTSTCRRYKRRHNPRRDTYPTRKTV